MERHRLSLIRSSVLGSRDDGSIVDGANRQRNGAEVAEVPAIIRSEEFGQQMDDLMARMQAADEKNNSYHGCGPRLNPKSDPSKWLSNDHAPWAKLDNEKPPGETIAYDELIKRWTEHQQQ